MRPKTAKMSKNAQCSFPALVSGLKIPEKEVRKHKKSCRGLMQGGAKKRTLPSISEATYLRCKTQVFRPPDHHRSKTFSAVFELPKTSFFVVRVSIWPESAARARFGAPRWPDRDPRRGPLLEPRKPTRRMHLIFRKNADARPSAISGELSMCVWRGH